MPSLALKYAPQSLDDIVAQDKAVKQLKLIASRDGIAGKAYWITGSTGTGKTSLVNVTARMIAETENIVEIDCANLTVNRIADVEQATRNTALDFNRSGKTGWAIVINESHGLRADTMRQLLTTLERIPSHVAWFFTTTRQNNDTMLSDKADGAPLIGRCVPINLSRQSLANRFALHVLAIARLEGLATEKHTVKRFTKLAYDCQLSMREMFSVVESGEFVV